MNEERETLQGDVLVAFEPFQELAHPFQPHSECPFKLACAAMREVGFERGIHDGRSCRAGCGRQPVKLFLVRLVEVELMTRLHGVPQNSGIRSSPGPRRCSPSFMACAFPTAPSCAAIHCGRFRGGVAVALSFIRAIARLVVGGGS